MTAWWENANPGGPMIGPPFIRPLYPPDAAKHGKQPSTNGDDIVAIKRAVSRSGHWPWQQFSDEYSNSFAHGKGPNVSENGLAGLQRQNGVDATGWMGEHTYNLIRSARIPQGLPHAGEPLLDHAAVELLEQFARSYNDDTSGTRCRLSDHFVVEEFDCNDGTKVPSAWYDALKSLCRNHLEPLHAAYGPVTVNSGYRTPSYNASVGGASNSFHIYTAHDTNDPAADVSCAHGSSSQWHAKLDSTRQAHYGGNGGLGLYPTFCHIDLRDYPSDWSG
jgi:uncharacterized protein YcbK (DUF882 family)